MREADRVLGVVVLLIQESSAEARAQGRRALFLMHQSDSGEFEKVMKKQCNEAQLRKCREVLDKIVSSGDPVSLGTKKPSSAKVCPHFPSYKKEGTKKLISIFNFLFFFFFSFFSFSHHVHLRLGTRLRLP
jgi:hypothetical protein